MVFSSLPSYLDPPSWPPQQTTGSRGGGDGGGCGGGDHGFSQLPPPPFPPHQMSEGGCGGEAGMGRPAVLMSERVRMAKLTQPEAAMKCPRCESTNTKFCYFNNYSLSQPRHFCKTCRRYWTRGGALRNVPVGGGCRRNKKSGSKGSRRSRSKSPASTRSTSTTLTGGTTDALGHYGHHSQPSQFPFLPSLHHLGDHYGGGEIGLTFGGGNGIDLTQIGPHKFAQFPCLEATNAGIYQFHGSEGSRYGGGQFGSKVVDSEELKMEENHLHHHHQQVQNLSKNFLGVSGNDQFFSTSNVAWSTTDVTDFPSSSTTAAAATTNHLL